MIPLDLGHKYYGYENQYANYDNYNAINIDKITNIPYDFEGIMGVPISFMDKYSPEQFEIIKFRKGDDDKDLRINGKCPYFRILVKKGNKRLSLVVQTICATGIRVSELRYITMEAVQSGRAEVNCKGKHRVIFLPVELQKKLRLYAKEKGIQQGSEVEMPEVDEWV